MTDEQTNKTDTQGTQTDKVMEKPLSIVDEAKKVRDEIRAENDRREEILKKEEALKANAFLGGDSGGHIETPEKSAEEAKKQGAKEFFKGTPIEGAIEKYG